MSGSAAATVPAAAKPQTLDELMLAMDVVDTIRHRELIVERELTQGEREDALRTRLREIYRGQGIEVTDTVIDEGIKALRESRFVYTPPAPSLGRSLAMMWINRGRLGLGLAMVAVVIAAVWGAYQYTVVWPAERARVELATVLPKSLQSAYDAVIREARVDAAKTQAGALLTQGQSAIARDDAGDAHAAVAGLETLRERLALNYTLRITSGVTRIPLDNQNVENHYLVVEAIGANGKAIKMPIKNEETGRTDTVDTWGVRVSPSIYDDVRRDMRDDGIIQNNVLAEKRRGALEPQYRMTVQGGAITKWEEN